MNVKIQEQLYYTDGAHTDATVSNNNIHHADAHHRCHSVNGSKVGTASQTNLKIPCFRKYRRPRLSLCQRRLIGRQRYSEKEDRDTAKMCAFNASIATVNCKTKHTSHTARDYEPLVSGRKDQRTPAATKASLLAGSLYPCALLHDINISFREHGCLVFGILV
jgi:hypothetical protein